MREYRMLPTVLYKEGRRLAEEDAIAIETALELRLDDVFIAAFVCTPGLENELAVGFLLSSGIVDQPGHIASVKTVNNRCSVKLMNGVDARKADSPGIRRVVTTECSAPDMLRTLRTGGEIPRLDFKLEVEPDLILSISSGMRDVQEVHKRTGATHAALIQEIGREARIIAEDLGRHNAVDKCIGLAAAQSRDFRKCLLFSSGRLTADVVSKCSWSSIPLLVSSSVATDAGVKVAEKGNITLIGALRGNRMRVYHEGAAKLVHE
ncbi:MAG: formate dehydrogenase accessory sulfurtransferase FdhD [Candidatus Thorarchaeota archaeon]